MRAGAELLGATLFVAGAGGLSALAINWLWARRRRHRPPAPATPKIETGPDAAANAVPALHRKDRIILWVALAAVVIMGLFPPWHVKVGGRVVRDWGYRFIADPPTSGNWVGEIDLVRLFIQWAVITAAAFAGVKLRR